MNPETFQQLYELLEDTLEYFSDENTTATKVSWLAVEQIAKSKRIELGVTHPCV